MYTGRKAPGSYVQAHLPHTAPWENAARQCRKLQISMGNHTLSWYRNAECMSVGQGLWSGVTFLIHSMQALSRCVSEAGVAYQ